MSQKFRRSAFLFGNSSFSDTRLNQLNAPENDIKSLHTVLESSEICGFDEVKWAVNSTLGAVQTDLVKFLRDKKRDDFILIYYTGHGLLDTQKKLFLALKDTNPEHPDIGSISSGWLSDKLNNCRSKRQLLILDCCHSGAYIDGAKNAQEEPAIYDDTFDQNGYGRYVLASSSRTQVSTETKGASDYTKALVEGLETGAASAGKKWISVIDLEEYLASKFATASAPMQPESTVHEKVGQLMIAANQFFVPPISSELLKKLYHTDSTVRIGAVTQLKMLAESTTSIQRRDKIINVLRERLNPDSENMEDSKAVSDTIDLALKALELTEGEPSSKNLKERAAKPLKASDPIKEEPEIKQRKKGRTFWKIAISFSIMLSILAGAAIVKTGFYTDPDFGELMVSRETEAAITDTSQTGYILLGQANDYQTSNFRDLKTYEKVIKNIDEIGLNAKLIARWPVHLRKNNTNTDAGNNIILATIKDNTCVTLLEKPKLLRGAYWVKAKPVDC